jgi:predicted HTH domain antitoxin
MTIVSVELPESAFSALRRAPEEFVKEMRLAAAVKWYELGEISQEKAAEIAGLTRSEFINALARFRVSPFQYSGRELAEELSRVE